MDLFENLNNDAFEYDVTPVNIGSWVSYMPYHDIHPFCDGNGRLGRLLMNNYLISRNIESCRDVSFFSKLTKTGVSMIMLL